MTSETLSIIAIVLSWLSWLGTRVYQYHREARQKEALTLLIKEALPFAILALETKTLPKAPSDASSGK